MLSEVITFIALAFTLVYCQKIVVWTIIWAKRKKVAKNALTRPEVSVVVAIHNEAKNVTNLVTSLLQQTEQPKQIVFVLDYCTDNTLSVLQPFADRITIVENYGPRGKKYAQRLGVEMVQAGYVVVTDADCVMNSNWISAIADNIANADLLISPVTMKANDKSVAQQLMEVEFLALQIITATTALKQKATMCNGANLAFKRSVYLQHNSHTNYVSGDDMFLLSETKQNGGQIVYNLSPNALVTTSCPASVWQYYKQRSRWLRKASGYTDSDVKWLSAVVFIGNMAWPVCLFFSPLRALICFCLKTIAELLMLRIAQRHWGVKCSVPIIILLAIVYPFNLLAISLLSVFRNKHKW